MIEAAATPSLSPSELETILRKADPAVVLVSPRILRRVIWQTRADDSTGPLLLRQQSYLVPKKDLLPHLDRIELRPLQPEHLPDHVILLVNNLDNGESAPRSHLLRRYWRLIYQARVRLALQTRFAPDRITEADIQSRIDHIGRTEFAEIEYVLKQEHHLTRVLHPAETYILFVTLYWDLHYFAPHLLPIYFPGLQHRADLESRLLQDVDAAAIYQQTRPEGAPLAGDLVETADTVAEARPHSTPSLQAVSAQALQAELVKASEAHARGNLVRAAIVQTQLAQRTADTQYSASARAHLQSLAQRLQAALELAGIDHDQWSDALTPLLVPAARGFWTVSARLLYDLQKACVDAERTLYDTNLVRWLITLGHQPLKRELPAQQQVLPLKHLRGALRRLPLTGLPQSDRDRLETLLGDAIHQTEERVRAYFRPRLEEALKQVDLKPNNLPEQVSRDKLREELLDRIVERGLLNMSDLRDAIARNQVKLPDVAHPVELVTGDKLLHLNSKLAATLHGVYHGGEFYLRWLQSFTSLAFGTRLGRLLTLYLVVPFGGAFVALKGLYFMYLEILHLTSPHDKTHADAHDPPDLLTTPWSVGLLGLFLFLMIHCQPFRWQVGNATRLVGRGLYHAFITFPHWFFNLPLVQNILNHRIPVFLFQLLFKPLLIATFVLLIFFLFRVPSLPLAITGGSVFAVSLVFFRTRAGRITDEILSNWLVEGVHRLSFQMIPIAFRAILDAFKWMVGEVERYLYNIDEWLRFHTGESRLSLAVKAVLGSVWAGVSYLIRLVVILIIEPTINPIKHFPVVTVAGKFMLPLLPILTALFVADPLAHAVNEHWAVLQSVEGPERIAVTQIAGLRQQGQLDQIEPQYSDKQIWRKVDQKQRGVGDSGRVALAVTLASLIVFAAPGVFGFMAWELKENWRLYAANRRRTLDAAPIGHHGETMLQLLRPGFHSGTIPSLYHRWRGAECRDRPRTIRKCHQKLAEVEHTVCHFFEREFIDLLAQSGRLPPDLVLSIAAVHIAITRVAVSIRSSKHGDDLLQLAFDLRSRWLVCMVLDPGWTNHLAPEQKEYVNLAWKGLCRKAAVAFSDSELRHELTPALAHYDIKADALLAWPDDTYRPRLTYDLTNPEPQFPVVEPSTSGDWPRLERDRILLTKNNILWSDWVHAWEFGISEEKREP
jgi:hypothetical protein